MPLTFETDKGPVGDLMDKTAESLEKAISLTDSPKEGIGLLLDSARSECEVVTLALLIMSSSYLNSSTKRDALLNVLNRPGLSRSAVSAILIDLPCFLRFSSYTIATPFPVPEVRFPVTDRFVYRLMRGYKRLIYIMAWLSRWRAIVTLPDDEVDSVLAAVTVRRTAHTMQPKWEKPHGHSPSRWKWENESKTLNRKGVAMDYLIYCLVNSKEK